MLALRPCLWKVAALAVAAAATLSTASCGKPAAAQPVLVKGDKGDCPEAVYPPVAIPAFVDWDGNAGVVGEHMGIVLEPHAQFPGDYVAYFADWKTPAVTAAIHVPIVQLPSFIQMHEGLAAILIRNPTPPPPPVTPDDFFEMLRVIEERTAN